MKAIFNNKVNRVLCYAVLCLVNVSLHSQIWRGDTLTINPITFSDPSPVGWNAQYNTVVSFPEEQSWSQILMIQTLKCDSLTAGDKYPCGEWDYIWNTFIKVPQGDSVEVYTLGSFVTPYGKRLKLGGENGWEWVYDITEYAPLLTGVREITTGNNQELLDLKFAFIKGQPSREVLSVQNIYPYGEYKYEFLADDSLLKAQQIILSPEAVAYSIKATISGHGHAGPYNCCEWDSKTHTYRFNGWETFRWNVWKNCGDNPIYPQGGTWPFDRAGWCPGTKVDEYEFELTPKVSPGDTLVIDYSIEPYQENGEKDGTLRMSHQLFSYGPPTYDHDPAIVEIMAPNSKNQYGRLNPATGNHVIIIENKGRFPLESLALKYGVQGKRKKKYHWTGYLAFLDTQKLILPTIPWKHLRNGGEFEVEILSNKSLDENPKNNYLKSSFTKPEVFPSEFILSIQTNNLGRSSENRFYIRDAKGVIWYEQNMFKDSTLYRLPIELSKGSYQFFFEDDMEDGVSVHWWNRNAAPELVGMNGKVQFESIQGDTLYRFPADFGEYLSFNFLVE